MLTDPESQRRTVIRRAAGLYDVNDDWQGHLGRWVCPDCPDESQTPPLKAFALGIHRREHEERTGHQLLIYCYICVDFHLPGAIETTLEVAWLPDGPPRLMPETVIGALQVLQRSGFLITVRRDEPPALPEPEIVLLPYSEAETLKLVRERLGITTREIAEHFGLARTTVKTRVRMLKLGGHVKSDGFNDGWQRLYPTHDRPIGRVRPREQVQIQGPRLGDREK